MMAEKMTPQGLVVGLIIEPEKEEEPKEAPAQEVVNEKPKRTRKPKESQ